MYRIAVLVSGGGTNLQAIIDRIADGTIPDTEIALVVSNRRAAYALERAEKAGIPSKVIHPKKFASEQAFGEALTEMIRGSRAELVVLAGCLMTIPPELIRAYPDHIINIHPSLIPSFCGKGYYGLTVHEKALERGVKVTGATVHIVDEKLDHGPILLQKAVQVLPGDTPEKLQLRVMRQAEWVILPEAVKCYAQGRVTVKDGHAEIRPEE
ncbi:MAG: phosphoribosylglycinamide formyltransferase [Lachnospiraceae bacterium]